ncbi:Threonyl/alanyl tRNA synthetase SAD [Caldalkalibacillus thermarum TA2.A1]|uniref:Alanyl-tRNA editing protein n=1 Tax=Caldalkalibacillus thermarum (strain TA2.A1) TaxID=986075 RepID=F5L482_CALTT|nr:alanyl-tRNA editing protein [Caldalkalibacillus thermarum]EGL83847.1 Threonyl/alanyl tRNA synthetase SAD [Caldalkalibacillus thermarum TA2.A1]QZT34103.1 alanyl-tRNA editing protein [Caldalkalibacillus thermarum TA2.A1]
MTTELYLENSYLKTFRAQVCEINGEEVVLDQTLFYRGGGGQEHDTGFLIQNGKEFEVYEVKKQNGLIVHYVKQADHLSKGEVELVLDWERRYNLMRHHTLIHVLGAVVYNRYGSLCTVNQIYENRARIDFNNLSDLSEEEIKDIEEETNRQIQANHPVSSRVVSRKEAEQLTGIIKTMVNLLPPAVKNIRLVKIGEIDEQACGETHVKETQEIGTLKITKVKSKGKNNKRLEVQAIES